MSLPSGEHTLTSGGTGSRPRIGPTAGRRGAVWLVLMVACAPTEQAPSQGAPAADTAVTTASSPTSARDMADTVRPRVPAVAPNHTPPGFYGPENIRHGSACLAGAMLRGIVVVVFEEGATQAERQAAVDLVKGEVVGGINPGVGREGYYYIRVEDDPDGQILCDATDLLDDLPQVALAVESIVEGYPS
jgi:hypothetical protein